MTNKNIFVLVISSIILSSAIALQIQRSFFDEPIIITPSIVSSSTVSTTSTTKAQDEAPQTQLTSEQKDKLEGYLKANLSTLSPAPEVLGGKFYLTEFIITGADTAKISYEDGHNSFSAEITYKIQNNLAYLQNFTIISQNNQPYSTNTSSSTPN